MQVQGRYGTLPKTLTFDAHLHLRKPRRRCLSTLEQWSTNLMSRRFLRLIDRSPVPCGGYCARKAGMEFGLPVRVGQGITAGILRRQRAGRHHHTDQPELVGWRPSSSRAYHSTGPFSGPFRSKSDEKGVAPGPQAGNNRNRGPGTHPHSPPGSPSSSQRASAATRYVAEWFEFVYLSRGPHDTQYLSSCLATSASKASRFPGRPSGQ
jgi:hypothetical protein